MATGIQRGREYLPNIYKKGKKHALEIGVFGYVILLGLIFTFIIPPFQKPDENVHFLRAVAISNGQLSCEETSEGKQAFNIPQKYFTFLEKTGTNRIAFRYEEKFFLQDLINAEKEAKEVKADANFEGFCNLPFFSYIPASISILFGEIFNSVTLGFYLSRMVGFVIFISAIIWSYRKISKSNLRWIILLYSLLPMVLHQASAVGYDYLQLAIAPMLFALVISLSKVKEVKNKDVYLFCVLTFMFLLAKPGYYFFSLLYFLIPKDRISKSKGSYIFFTIGFLLICILILLVYLLTSSSGDYLQGARDINPYLQIQLLLNPKYTILLFKNTLVVNAEFYFKSFIGMFGWLDYELSAIFYMIPLVLLGGFSVYFSRDYYFKEYKIKLIVLGTMLLISVLFLFTTFYLTTNEVGYWQIVGLQGRYFLVFFPFLIVFASSLIRAILESRIFRLVIVFSILSYILFEIVFAIYTRYYRYSDIEQGLVSPIVAQNIKNSN